jgi:hypothetical protein
MIYSSPKKATLLARSTGDEHCLTWGRVVVRLHSAIDYVTPKGMLAGNQQEIQAERDRLLDAAKEQRKNRRQRAALWMKRIAPVSPQCRMNTAVRPSIWSTKRIAALP